MTDWPQTVQLSDATWDALRRLLSGGASSQPASLALSQAAHLGEVELLATKADPALAPWLEVFNQQRREQAMLLSFAEARVQEVLEASVGEAWSALKGSTSAHTLYAEPAERVRRDVDILVQRSDIPRVREAAERAGWRDVTHTTHRMAASEGPYEVEYLVPIGSARIGCDVHRALVRWTEFQVDTGAILGRSRTLDSGWRVCGPGDLLIHTAIHAANAAFRVPLRSWLDVSLLVDSGSLDWDEVIGACGDWRVARCVWSALIISERWFGVSAPPEVMGRLSPGGSAARRLSCLLEGRGAWVTSVPQTTRLRRAWTRMLLRDSVADAGRYLWQTLHREMTERLTGSPERSP